MPSPLLRFGDAADQLRRQQLARLSDAVVPRLEALRSMTLPAFREVVALMLDRFGHDVATNEWAERKSWACSDDLNRCICRSRRRVGRCEFSARLFRYRLCRCSMPGSS